MHCRGAGAPLDHGGVGRDQKILLEAFFFFSCKLMVEGSLKQGNGREYILLAVWKDR